MFPSKFPIRIHRYTQSKGLQRCCLALWLVAAGACSQPDTRPSPEAGGRILRIAVASNFTHVLEAIAADYEREHQVPVTLSSGATGMLTVQIRAGAPFDILLAADAEHPQLLIAQGLALESSRFTYAVGRLVLAVAERHRSALQPDRLLAAWQQASTDTVLPGAGMTLAIANPDIAPYGRAAVEVLGDAAISQFRVAEAANVTAVYGMLRSGAADFGLLARSALVNDSVSLAFAEVDPSAYTPIRQQAVQLTAAAEPEVAAAFLQYLRSPAATGRILAAGYGLSGDAEDVAR